MKHNLLQVMVERVGRRILSGRFEVDDANLSSQRPSKWERGSSNKVSSIVAIPTNDDRGPPWPRLNRITFIFVKAAVADWANKTQAALALVTSKTLHCSIGFHGNVADHHSVITGPSQSVVVTNSEI